MPSEIATRRFEAALQACGVEVGGVVPEETATRRFATAMQAHGMEVGGVLV